MPPKPPALGLARRRGTSADLRRAYELLTRIDILEAALAGPAFCDVSTLAALALEELATGNDRVAADLLRAAEHICFAAQAPNGYAACTMRVFSELRRALDQEFDTLIRRSELFRQERGSRRHGAVPDLCGRTLRMAREAYAEDALGRALELARAAELLAEIVAGASHREQEAEAIAS
jgi:hypothetical protein